MKIIQFRLIEALLCLSYWVWDFCLNDSSGCKDDERSLWIGKSSKQIVL